MAKFVREQTKKKLRKSPRASPFLKIGEVCSSPNSFCIMLHMADGWAKRFEVGYRNANLKYIHTYISHITECFDISDRLMIG